MCCCVGEKRPTILRRERLLYKRQPSNRRTTVTKRKQDCWTLQREELGLEHWQSLRHSTSTVQWFLPRTAHKIALGQWLLYRLGVTHTTTQQHTELAWLLRMCSTGDCILRGTTASAAAFSRQHSLQTHKLFFTVTFALDNWITVISIVIIFAVHTLQQILRSWMYVIETWLWTAELCEQ